MLFSATLNQMAFLFSLIAIGYILSKFKIVPENSETVLSRLENYVFLPALVLGTFMTNFTVKTLVGSWKILLVSLAIEAVVIPLAFICSRLCAKDRYTRNIYLYGLSFSNFGFLGNAVVNALFPEIFVEYIIFTLVLWILIYVWGVPTLLMGQDKKQTLKDRLRNILNPMIICMFIGMLVGLFGIKLPDFAASLVKSAGDCMSPVAMLLTGMTISKMKLSSILKIKSLYVISVIRLLVFPALFIACAFVLRDYLPDSYAICAICSLAMPLGLNTIVIPSAFGKDTKVASGMALVSHILAIGTIPLIFLISEKIF